MVQRDVFLIFDMDGVMVDSNPFHKMAWKTFCQANGCSLTDDELQRHVYGKTNQDALCYLFDDKLDAVQLHQFALQKEQLYRELFKPALAPLPGLISFLARVQPVFAGLAVATSAPPDNVTFVLDTLNLRRFFSVIADETMVCKGKPDPEIYLETARQLGAKPSQCIVFEDSLSGIRAAKSAGMRVVGVTTTHSKEELTGKVDFTVRDFIHLAEDFSVLWNALPISS